MSEPMQIQIRHIGYIQLDASNMIMVVDNNVVLNLLNGMIPEKDLQ